MCHNFSISPVDSPFHYNTRPLTTRCRLSAEREVPRSLTGCLHCYMIHACRALGNMTNCSIHHLPRTRVEKHGDDM